MPVLWQSSQRPMYIRTIWVDGFRHAVLTHDDPHYLKLIQKRHRPRSSASKSSKKRVRSSKIDDLDEDRFKNFDIVITNDRVLRPDRSGVSKEVDIEKLDLSEVEIESESEFIVKATPQTLYKQDTVRTRFAAFCLDMKTIKTNNTDRSDGDDNELSERVLQWLDLAGKVELLKDNTERLSQPRHSWPEIQRNRLTKCKTADVEDRNKENKNKRQLLKPPDYRLAPQSGIIDPQGYVSSSNTIEVYARESRHAKHTPKENTSNFKAKQQDLRTNIAEARKKLANERNAVKKQYAELLTKKLIPEFKNCKKQMHIYIPELKKSSDVGNQSEVESSLSQITRVT